MTAASKRPDEQRARALQPLPGSAASSGNVIPLPIARRANEPPAQQVWDRPDLARLHRRVQEVKEEVAAFLKDVSPEGWHERGLEWRGYFGERLKDEALTPVQRDAMQKTWEALESRCPLLRYPTSGIDDEGSFYFSWSPRNRSMDIAIDRAGAATWFFADHTTGFKATSDDWHGQEYLAFIELFSRA